MFYVQRRGESAGCSCVLMYAFCAVSWEESWVFSCDNVCFVQCRWKRAGVLGGNLCVLCSAVERELGVFV